MTPPELIESSAKALFNWLTTGSRPPSLKYRSFAVEPSNIEAFLNAHPDAMTGPPRSPS